MKLFIEILKILLEVFFGTKVKVDAGPKKGKIIIEYATNEDLERILGLIK
jgi:hypothetical protein